MKWKKLFPDFKKAELFSIDEKFLSMLGFWPGNVINFRSVFFVMSCLFLEIIPELWFIIKNLHDIQKVFMCLHEFISLIVFLIKICILVRNKDEMFDLISNLRNEWKKSCNIENPHWKLSSDKLERRIFKFSGIFYKFIFFSASTYFSVPTIIFFSFMNFCEIGSWPFPVQVYFGFQFQEYPFAYFLLLVPTIIHMLVIAKIFYGLDILYINLMVYVTSFFRYVQCKIQHLNQQLAAKKIKGNELKKEIAAVIEAHNVAIKFAEQLEDVSNILVLVLYSVNTVVLCFLFFEFNILSEDLLNFFKVLIFFGVVQMLLFWFSYFGTNLEEESKLIADLIYDLPWYEIEDRSLARSLSLCILRAQRPCLITAGKFYPLNFESYLNSVKTAYSFCTVLKDII